MPTWVAAFDASGSENDFQTPYVTVAGFLSTEDEWQCFSKLWNSRLQKDGLQYFRMTEFAQSVKQFSGWKSQEPRRRRLLGDLFDLIKTHAFRKFGTVVQVVAMKELLDDKFRRSFHLTAYSLAARSAVGDVWQWMKAQGMLNTPVAMVFEDGDAGKGELRKRLERDDIPANFRPKNDQEVDGVLVPGFVPFQACDILAYEMGLLARQDRPESQWRWAAKELLKFPGHIGIFTSPDIQSLRRELEAEINAKPSRPASIS